MRRTAGNISNEILNIAEETAAADRIVIAAPFWDMSFPAALKTLIEQISINGIMFEDTPSGTKGLCRAEKILYITTRGMDISTGSVLEQASGYIKAVAHLWGIPECCFVSAIGTDIVSEEELQIRLNAALEEGLKIAGEF